MASFQILLPNEYDYNLNLEFLKRSPRELLHRVEGNQIVKLIQHDNQKILFRIGNAGKKLKIDFINGDQPDQVKKFVKKYIIEWFDLETDLKPFYAHVANDKLLGPLSRKFFGYRIIGQPDLFESIVWAVLGQQINLQFAYTLKQRFVEQFGERLFYNNESYFLFPSPQLVGSLTNEHLLPLQFSRQKSEYTIGIAQAFASGALSKEKLQKLSFDEAKEELRKIKGIGNWTANYALMKTFRYPDAFPLEDAGIHNAIKNLKGMDRKPTLHEVRKIFKKYKGWEAYATLYLWKSL